MKTKAALLSLALLIPSVVSFSQIQEKITDFPIKKNLIGIQYNPLLDHDRVYVANLISVRYGYKIFKPLIIGVEVNGTFSNNNFTQYMYDAGTPNQHYWISPGIFLRYSVRPDKRIQGFLEGSSYSDFFFNRPMKYHHNGGIEFYIAPGLSILSKNKKFSLDLYYKYPTELFLNERHGLFSYKLNYHF